MQAGFFYGDSVGFFTAALCPGPGAMNQLARIFYRLYAAKPKTFLHDCANASSLSCRSLFECPMDFIVNSNG
jgi:hypothetical protein